MKRYTQPKAGTDDKQVQKDIDYDKINPKIRIGNTIASMPKIYRGNTNNEWQ